MRPALAIAATLLAALASACGGAPARLSEADGQRLAVAEERIADAARTVRVLEQSPERAREVYREVRRIVATGAFEAERLDSYGLAAIGELRLSVPSLVLVDEREIPRRLDRAALRAFLDNAPGDPARALRVPAQAEVDRIVETLEEADAGPDTEIPVVDRTTTAYLGDVERRLRPAWPDLADEIAATRDEL